MASHYRIQPDQEESESMSNMNRTKGFAQLHALGSQLDKVDSTHLDNMIKHKGQTTCSMGNAEAIYRLAVEVAHYRKKEQLGYVQ